MRSSWHRRSAWSSTSCFDTAGLATLIHATPDRRYPLAAITVSRGRAEPSLGEHVRRVAPAMRTWPPSGRGSAAYLDAEPDKTLAFVAEMDMGTPEGAVVYACPMHPEVVSARKAAARSAG